MSKTVSAKRILEVNIELPSQAFALESYVVDGVTTLRIVVPQGEWGYMASALREAADELDENWR